MTNLSTIAAMLREQLADLDAGHVGLDRLELAADLARGVGLEVPHVLVRRPAGQVDVDDRLVLRAAALVGLGAKQVGQRQPAGDGPPMVRKSRRLTPSQKPPCLWALPKMVSIETPTKVGRREGIVRWVGRTGSADGVFLSYRQAGCKTLHAPLFQLQSRSGDMADVHERG